MLQLMSCQKQLMDYEGVEGVYFAVQHGASYGNERTWPYQPYTNVEFIKTSKADLTANIKVMITGPTKDYDRTFRVAVNPDSTSAVEGVHYLPLQDTYVIAANSTFTYIPVTLKRTEDIKKSMKTLGLRLLANDNFQLSFPNWDAVPGFTSGTVVKNFDASLHSIRINNFFVQPNIWTGSIQAGNREAGLFGAFSQRKMQLILDLMNLTYEDFENTTTMPSILQNLIANTCSRYLEQQLTIGKPVLEEDGRLMFFGYVSWTSYIGIPYVPKP